MSRPTTTGAGRMLHCSPDRTLFVTTDGEAQVVYKVFVRGSMQDAEREVEIGRQLAHLDVVCGQHARIDEVTNRPCIVLDWHSGFDLSHLVSQNGAIPAARSAAMLEPVARTLAIMHAQETAAAPHGICHGDIKPGNLLISGATTLLLDFEHARAIPANDGEKWITGTLGFASPEAKVGAEPSEAIDVFGLGATLRWLLTGGGSTNLPQDTEVEALISACTADDPATRPSADAVAQTLALLRVRLDDDPEEAILRRLAAGERLDFVSDSPRHTAMQRLATRQRRLLATFPRLLTVPDKVPTTPAGLHRALHNVQHVLHHFPQHGPTLNFRTSIANAAGELFAGAASSISAQERDDEYEEAARWLEDAVALAKALLQLPYRHPIPGTDDPRTAGLLHRDPIAYLRRLQEQLGEAKAELVTAVSVIESAEERLDLAAAEAAIDAMAKRYGGSSPTAARRRDLLHRLTFYLHRIAGAHPNVERLGQTWDKTALEALAQFVADCSQSANRSSRDEPTTPLGLRSLQVTLVNLAEEFPHLYVRSGPALDALSSALEHTSDQAWELVSEARRQLDAVPVPVRPMQVTLGRLDTFRILEALIDRPERPRSQLLDSIESLRLKFEQARAARDHLAEGAEQAMARGHWTTGLFDMERAIAGMNPNDEGERKEALRLEERLTEARKQKRELEASVRRNVELGNQYGMLQDDATSSFAQRLEALTERRNCLHFLALNLPAERAQLYTGDLREVELQIALEEAELAENEFDKTEEPAERLQLAGETLDRLEASLLTAEFAGEPPGRLLRLLEHWRTVVAQCQRDEERHEAVRELRGRGRRRLLVASILSLVVTLTVVGWAAGPWLLGVVAAATQNSEDPQQEHTELIARFQRAEPELPPRVAAAARRVLAAVRIASDPDVVFDATDWHADLAQALVEFTGYPEAQKFDALAADAWRLGLWFATQRTRRGTDAEELAQLTASLAARLAQRGIEAPSVVSPANR